MKKQILLLFVLLVSFNSFSQKNSDIPPEEDATNIIMCDNDIQLNNDTNELCPNFIHIKVHKYPAQLILL